ncbi:sigma-70 family RNA polymerase sigma factor [Erythrobacter sp.]|uniref:RNA polymerase sigma factor n=1 Tax=Erythrobacter sp. TaxID=1042 RepID=UPI00311E5A13
MNRATSLRYDNIRTEFGAAIARIASAYEADRSRQQDLQQEIHLAIWRGLPGFREECSLKTWVYRVANNVAATFVAKEMRQRRGQLVSLDDECVIPTHPGHESEVDHKLRVEMLHTFLHTLKLPDRQIALLYLEGHSASDIGEITGLKPAAVAMRIHRLKTVLSKSNTQKGTDHV